LPKIEIREGESFESAMRKFKKQIEQEGILKEVRDRKHYQKPSERKRKKMRERKINRCLWLYPLPGMPSAIPMGYRL